jgi:hypothetical protein
MLSKSFVSINVFFEMPRPSEGTVAVRIRTNADLYWVLVVHKLMLNEVRFEFEPT